MKIPDTKVYLLGSGKRGWWCGGDIWSPHPLYAVIFQDSESAMRQAKLMNLPTWQVIQHTVKLSEGKVELVRT